MMTRKELYAKVKENKLEEKIKSVYGKNYTQVSNEFLLKEITKFESSTKKETKKPVKKTINETKKDAIKEAIKKAPFIIPKNIYEHDNVLDISKTAILMLDVLMDILQTKHIVTEKEVEEYGLKHMKDIGLIN